jgi:short-subunit dehydrogenase
MSRGTMIVTGASAGVGRELALQAAQSGFDVIATGRDAARLANLVRDAAGAPGAIETVAIDLRSPGAAASIVARALQRFGRIDVLVNNAGAVAVGPIAQQSDAALAEQFAVHVTTPLAVVREALPALRAARGHVFFVGSGVARVPVAGLGAYPSAKAAVRNAARIARGELRRDGIAVTYVDPGAVATGFMLRAGLAGAPPGIAAKPQDVARKILRAVGTRRGVVNAVPWQTALLGVAELFPAATDALLARFPSLVGAQGDGTTPHGSAVEAPPPPQPPPPPRSAAAITVAAAATAEALEAKTDAFSAALAAQARRMERLKFAPETIAALLVPGTTLDANEVALRWAGMPNKNERALVHDLLEALAEGGFLEPSAEGTYVVLRPARP